MPDGIRYSPLHYESSGLVKIYGSGTKAVMKTFQCSEEEARQLLKDYDRAFPRIYEFSKAYAREAADNGYILTRYGRRIPVEKDTAYRAVNYLVQGSAADLAKRGMTKVGNYLKESGYDAHLVAMIHDEVVVETNKKHAFKHVLRNIAKLMSDHEGHFSVPLPVECEKVTKTWAEKVAVEL
jgi:DNA polymerase-1